MWDSGIDFAIEIHDPSNTHYWGPGGDGPKVTIHELFHAYQIWTTGDPVIDAQEELAAQQIEKAPEYGGCNTHGSH